VRTDASWCAACAKAVVAAAFATTGGGLERTITSRFAVSRKPHYCPMTYVKTDASCRDSRMGFAESDRERMTTA